MCSNSTCKSCPFTSSHTNGYVRSICMWNNTWFHSYDCTVVSMTAHAEQSQRKAKLQEYLLCTLLTLGFTKEFDSSNHRKITSYLKPKQRMSMKFSNSFRSLMKHCRNYGDSVNNVFLCESSLNQTLEQWFPTGGSRPQSGSRRSFFGSRTAASTVCWCLEYLEPPYIKMLLQQQNRNTGRSLWNSHYLHYNSCFISPIQFKSTWL